MTRWDHAALQYRRNLHKGRLVAALLAAADYFTPPPF